MYNKNNVVHNISLGISTLSHNVSGSDNDIVCHDGIQGAKDALYSEPRLQ